jgi:hypothetical protein
LFPSEAQGGPKLINRDVPQFPAEIGVRPTTVRLDLE